MPNFDEISQSTVEIKLLPVLEKRTADIFEFYFWFRFRPVYCHRHAILHLPAKFRSNRTIVGGVMTSYQFFKMAAGSHIGFDLGNVGPPTECNCGLSLVLKFGLDPIYSFGDNAIFIFCRFGL